MAKVRIYELANELNIESKKLVEKLKSGGMNIKNYMSTLDEESVSKARDLIAGPTSNTTDTSEVIEEKRIKPTVIRRRKKTVKVESEIKETVAEERIVESAPKEAEAKKEKVVKEVKKEKIKAENAPPMEEEKSPAKVKKEKISPEPVTESPQPKTKVKIKGKTKKGKKKIIDQPAKIIKRPEEGPLKEAITKKKTEKTPAKKTDVIKPPEKEIKVIPLDESREKPRKNKKEKKRAVKEEIVPKGSVRHRKVAVFERADLYEGRKPRGKDKKRGRKAKDVDKKVGQTEITTPKEIKRRLKVQENVTMTELAKAMGVKAVELIKKLISMGVTANVNQEIDFETASIVADDFGYQLELDFFEEESILEEEEDQPEDLKARPPVVTIMGHVDHGKTSLLDYVRKSDIIGGESGGITQHIGAYFVETKGGDIVFLDTPGHEAFTAMRARGAEVTDIIVLLVAADDGVMPQTREAINHARAAAIPIIVAVNKIDKPEADTEKIKRELAEQELAPEEWGGETLFSYVSAITGEGIDELLDQILLQSEILELKTNPDKPARGTIIEARLDKSKGSVATVLIKSGSLKQSDYFICGETYGRVRAMLNSHGKRIESAGPSVPVEIYGISEVPMAGDRFFVVPGEKRAKQIIDNRLSRVRSREMANHGIVSLEDLYDKIKEGEMKELNIILKTDVQGSLEALADSLDKLSTEEVKLKIIHSSTGAITETDVMLASASSAIIIGFNVRANPRVTEVAGKEKIDIRYYDVIYNVIEDVRLAMTGLLEPIYKENVIGRADIKEVFHIPRVGAVAGCYVTDGYIERNAKVRLLREEVVIYDGNLSSLRRFKDDVREVQSGYECGMGLENFQDIKSGDIFEAYQVEEIQAEL